MAAQTRYNGSLYARRKGEYRRSEEAAESYYGMEAGFQARSNPPRRSKDRKCNWKNVRVHLRHLPINTHRFLQYSKRIRQRWQADSVYASGTREYRNKPKTVTPSRLVAVRCSRPVWLSIDMLIKS